MRRLFNLDAPIVQTVAKLGSIMWMNVLWLVCCLPVVTIGASSTALSRMTMNIREDKRCDAGEFFRAFAANFKKATAIWMLALLCLILLAAFYYGICLVGSALARMLLLAVFCILFLLAGFMILYAFPLTAYFENTVKNTIRNAFIMSLHHYRQTIIAFSLHMLPLVALFLSVYWFLYLGYIWLLIAPGLISYWSNGQLIKVFETYAEEE